MENWILAVAALWLVALVICYALDIKVPFLAERRLVPAAGDAAFDGGSESENENERFTESVPSGGVADAGLPPDIGSCASH